jgi:hypothetical protein
MSTATSRLQIYDGSTDPEDFVNSFKIQAAEWSPENQLEYLPLFLRGKAKRLYDAVLAGDKDTIAKALIKIVALCAKPKETLLYKFYQRQLQSGESVADYACALKELLDVASPGLTMEQQLPFLRAQICLQVPEHTRALIQFNSSLSWDQLLASLDKAFPCINQSSSSQLSGPIRTPSPPPLIKSGGHKLLQVAQSWTTK